MPKIKITTDSYVIYIDRDYVIEAIEDDNEDEDISCRSDQEIYDWMREYMYIDEMVDDKVVSLIPLDGDMLEKEWKRGKVVTVLT